MGKRIKRNTPARMMGRPMTINSTVRGRIVNDTLLSGNTYSGPITTGSIGTDSYIFRMWMDVDGSFLVNSTVRQIGSYYSEYKFQPSTTLHWEPSCPLTSTGNYWLAWTDNPELITSFSNAATTTSARIDMVKSVHNAKCYPIWQASTLRIGVSKRAWYSTDTTRFAGGSTTSERQLAVVDAERLMQGAFLFAVEGASPTLVVARAYVQEHIRVRGLLGTIPNNAP